MNSSKRGFPWQSSLGANLLSPPEFVRPGESATVNGQSHDGPFYIARKSNLSEASFVSLGADSKTSAVAAGENNLMLTTEQTKFIEAQGFDVDDLNEAQIKNLVDLHASQNSPDASSETVIGT